MHQEQEHLQRRVEEASMNAWPATHQLLLGGWLIRLSNGFTKRANCVVPLYEANIRSQSDTGQTSHVDIEKIRYCENLYAREQLQTIFRLTSHPHNMALDSSLAARGYERIDETQVQLLDLAAIAATTEPANGIRPGAGNPEPVLRLVTAPRWLGEYARLTEMPPAAGASHASLIRSIQPECAFALLEAGGETVACALGVLERDLFGLFDLVTARESRGQGFARSLLHGLLRWGAQRGAGHAYLQVIDQNSAALALYRRLGFQHLYSYWYRRTG